MTISEKINRSIQAKKKTYDKDGDGKLSQWELKLARNKEMNNRGITNTKDRQAIRKQTNSAFYKADTNKDGYVSKQEAIVAGRTNNKSGGGLRQTNRTNGGKTAGQLVKPTKKSGNGWNVNAKKGAQVMSSGKQPSKENNVRNNRVVAQNFSYTPDRFGTYKGSDGNYYVLQKDGTMSKVAG